MTDMERVQMPPITEYWKVLADDMDPSAGIEEEYHHKNDKVPTCSFMMFVFASNNAVELFVD
jgi:hypothetical protein